DLLQRDHVLLERGPPYRGEFRRGAWPLADEPLADLHVAGLFERGELLGQRRVGQPHAVADELELGPLGGGQQRHDREPGGRVNQLVEAGPDHRAPPVRLASMMRRSAPMSRGPPTTMQAAPAALPYSAGCATPAAWRLNATARLRPTVRATKPRISMMPRGPSRSPRTWTWNARRTTQPVLASTPRTNRLIPTPTTVG